MAEFIGLGGTEIHQDATAVTVAENDGAVGQMAIGPAHIIVNRPHLTGRSSEAGDVQHFDTKTELPQASDSLIPGAVV